MHFPGIVNAARIVGAVLIIVVGVYLVLQRTSARRRRQAADSDGQGTPMASRVRQRHLQPDAPRDLDDGRHRASRHVAS